MNDIERNCDKTCEILEALANAVMRFRQDELDDSDWIEVKYVTHKPVIENVSSMGTRLHYEEEAVSRRELKLDALKKFYESIESLEVYSKAVDCFRREERSVRLMKELGEFSASLFIQKVLFEERSIDELVRIAVEEVHERNAPWEFSVFIVGLEVESELQRAGSLTLRSPKTSDFPGYYLPPEHAARHVQKQSIWKDVQTVVTWQGGSIPRGMGSGDAIVVDIEQVVKQLRLAIGGRWIVTGWFANTDWVTEPSNHYDRTGVQWPLFRKMRELEVDHFPIMKFGYDEGERYNELEKTRFRTFESKSHVAVRGNRALEMYNEASQRKNVEAILFSTIGLESLFSTDQQELRLKIAIRTAMMLEMDGFSRSQVYDDVYQAYEIRSRFVHGNEVNTEKAKKLTPQLLEYLRSSILLWLQVSFALETRKRAKKKIDEFNKALEDSPMKEAALEKVKVRLGLSQNEEDEE